MSWFFFLFFKIKKIPVFLGVFPKLPYIWKDSVLYHAGVGGAGFYLFSLACSPSHVVFHKEVSFGSTTGGLPTSNTIHQVSGFQLCVKLCQVTGYKDTKVRRRGAAMRLILQWWSQLMWRGEFGFTHTLPWAFSLSLQILKFGYIDWFLVGSWEYVVVSGSF